MRVSCAGGGRVRVSARRESAKGGAAITSPGERGPLWSNEICVLTNLTNVHLITDYRSLLLSVTSARANNGNHFKPTLS
ncbi:hypothetical protein EVAR_7230_1 [Eumeta japonica]|uniref:Uncharacterized protein n=1 Tax=Eumeta variegata TaxID=151549 RepID=A0A4C1T2H9_EUMVA|nr:hypothetical protein EVAR_7230_1 [Eumeta japonica]